MQAYNFNENNDDWTWERDGDKVILQEPFRKKFVYNRSSIYTALENVLKTRSAYTTQGAWERQLRKFIGGVWLFVGGGNSNPGQFKKTGETTANTSISLNI